jgi:gliding motility-associated-like protein
VDGGTSRFDKDGSVYQAVCAGCGGNSDFPTTPGAWSADNLSSNCNIAVFKFDLGGVNALLDIEGPSVVCESFPAQFINNSSGATDFLWDFGDETTSTAEEPSHIYTSPGIYTITLLATDDTGCLEPDSASITIEIIEGVNPSVEEVDPICPGDAVQLSATGTDNLFWLDNPTLSATDIPNPIASPTVTTTYYAIDFNDCETDTVGVIVEVVVPVTSISENAEICLGESTLLEVTGGAFYEWSPAGFLSDPNGASTFAAPLDTTTFTCAITTIEGCETSEQVTVNVVFDAPGGNVYNDINMCIGGSAQLVALPGLSYTWSPPGTLSNANAQSPMAFPADTTVYTVDITNVCGMGTDTVTVNVITPHAEAFGGGTICMGSWIEAWATGGVDYFWQPVNYCSQPHNDTTLLSPPETMFMTVVVTDEYGCAAMDSVAVFIMPLPEVDAGPDQYITYLESTQLFGYANWDNFYWSPGEDLSCIDCLAPWVYPDSSGFYYLTVTDHNGCMAVDSVWVELFFPLWVPNAITPDGDGINDYFRAYGENITGFHMQIYDRWGLQIFESWDIEEIWDGGINGYYVQNDTYLWIIWYDTVDRKAQLMGHVTMVR